MRNRSRWLFIAVIALQVAFLLGVVAYKETTLRTGTTVVLQTVPVDPRDLFRGDFVVLRYEATTLQRQQVRFHDFFEGGDTVYVRLQKAPSANGLELWRASEVDDDPHDDWEVFLKGKVVGVNDGTLTVQYGIESFFVPEGQGRSIERAQDVKVRAAVNGFGDAVIKGLLVNGEPWRPE